MDLFIHSFIHFVGVSSPQTSVWEPLTRTSRPMVSSTLPPAPPPSQHRPTAEPACPPPRSPFSSDLWASLLPVSTNRARCHSANAIRLLPNETRSSFRRKLQKSNFRGVSASEKFVSFIYFFLFCPRILAPSRGRTTKPGQQRVRKGRPYDVDLVPSAGFGVRLENCR